MAQSPLRQFARSVVFIVTMLLVGLPFAVLMPSRPWLVLLIALSLAAMLTHARKRA